MNTLKINEYIKGKSILVTGGTGSFGEYLVRKLLTFSPKKVIVFSRDELKQYQLRNQLAKFEKILEFRIGDVRDLDSLLSASRGVDIIYHAAAMKHVPICEENPMEAVYTNIYGAYNLKEAAIRNKISKIIAISTDKAVRSVNVMGMSKAIQERILLSDNFSGKSVFVCVRFGNVVGSRGSVVPFFKEIIQVGKPLPLTDKKMTRFLINLKDAMDLIFFATLEGNCGELFVKKMPVCSIYDLAKVMIEDVAHVGIDEYKVNVVGLRQGEQLYESLVSDEEITRTVEKDGFYVIYPYGKKMGSSKVLADEYRTDLIKKRMTKEEIRSMLKESGWL
jgi:FlaA1/EpsC-like NDP-sugar epimerase